MVCFECSSCSWYKDIDMCGGLTKYERSNCPVEIRLRMKKSTSQENSSNDQLKVYDYHKGSV